MFIKKRKRALTVALPEGVTVSAKPPHQAGIIDYDSHHVKRRVEKAITFVWKEQVIEWVNGHKNLHNTVDPLYIYVAQDYYTIYHITTELITPSPDDDLINIDDAIQLLTALTNRSLKAYSKARLRALVGRADYNRLGRTANNTRIRTAYYSPWRIYQTAQEMMAQNEK